MGCVLSRGFGVAIVDSAKKIILREEEIYRGLIYISSSMVLRRG